MIWREFGNMPFKKGFDFHHGCDALWFPHQPHLPERDEPSLHVLPHADCKIA
jgi:hypothetical protein